jgi:hypothetical protein
MENQSLTTSGVELPAQDDTPIDDLVIGPDPDLEPDQDQEPTIQTAEEAKANEEAQAQAQADAALLGPDVFHDTVFRWVFEGPSMGFALTGDPDLIEIGNVIILTPEEHKTLRPLSDALYEWLSKSSIPVLRALAEGDLGKLQFLAVWGPVIAVFWGKANALGAKRKEILDRRAQAQAQAPRSAAHG